MTNKNEANNQLGTYQVVKLSPPCPRNNWPNTERYEVEGFVQSKALQGKRLFLPIEVLLF
ncbi:MULTISPECIES: hypothetical protein [Paenibacillus]|uniref:hypothetical protein n=1 Tax=Paenibacillus TaxID=44249 RepID=UPI001C6513DC|nr:MULTISPECIES: hypothetical protein [Paenibacillus]WCM62307.1 hypothetical protein OYT09_04870 [Paenibacillus polymyxa]